MGDPTAEKLKESELKKVLDELSSNIEECEHVAANLASRFTFVLATSSNHPAREKRNEGDNEEESNIIGYLKVLLNGVKETTAILKDTIDRSVI